MVEPSCFPEDILMRGATRPGYIESSVIVMWEQIKIVGEQVLDGYMCARTSMEVILDVSQLLISPLLNVAQFELHCDQLEEQNSLSKFVNWEMSQVPIGPYVSAAAVPPLLHKTSRAAKRWVLSTKVVFATAFVR